MRMIARLSAVLSIALAAEPGSALDFGDPQFQRLPSPELNAPRVRKLTLPLTDQGSTGVISGMSAVPSGGNLALPLADALGLVIRPEAFAKASADDTNSLQAAVELACQRGGSIVQLAPRTYTITKRITLCSGLTLMGSGYNAQWEAGSPVTMAGTIILARGTAPKDLIAYGITDERTSGGRLDNSAAAAFTAERTVALSSYYNEDANETTGAASTPARFSAAVMLPPGATGVTIRNLRIMLNNTGADGYSNATLALADDWDVGLYVNNAYSNSFDSVQVVGYWRKNGLLIRSSALPSEVPTGSYASAEANVFNNCTFTGYKSVAVRAAGLWRVTGSGSNWIEIPWAANHPFDPAIITAVTVGEFAPVNYQYTGVAKNGDKLRLTGVTPSPADLSSSSDLYPVQHSAGIAKTVLVNSTARGMLHFSKRRISDPAISGAMPPSAAIEVSGMRTRGLQLVSTKLQTYDLVLTHLHQTIDNGFINVHSEASAPVNATLRGLWIATPANSTRVPYPTGSTTLRTTLQLAQNGGDFSPDGGTRSSGYITNGFWSPNSVTALFARSGLHIGTEATINKLEAFEKNSYTPTLSSASSGDLSFSSVARSARYQMIDRSVTISGSYAATATYSTASGEIRFYLPFPVMTAAGYFASLSVTPVGFIFPNGYTSMVAQAASGQQHATFLFVGPSGLRSVNITDVPSGNFFRLSVSGSYFKP